MTQLKDDIFTIDLDDCTYTSNNSSDTITIDTSSWDDSFTTSPSSIYSPTGNVSIEGELTVGGVDVMQSIKDMQRVLGVVSRDIEKEEKFLLHSIDSIQDLYLIMLSSLIEIRKKEIIFLEASSKKHLATPEEKNPNRKFVNNAVLQLLEENKKAVQNNELSPFAAAMSLLEQYFKK